jgi:hypothetical protein
MQTAPVIEQQWKRRAAGPCLEHGGQFEHSHYRHPPARLDALGNPRSIVNLADGNPLVPKSPLSATSAGRFIGPTTSSVSSAARIPLVPAPRRKNGGTRRDITVPHSKAQFRVIACQYTCATNSRGVQRVERALPVLAYQRDLVCHMHMYPETTS